MRIFGVCVMAMMVALSGCCNEYKPVTHPDAVRRLGGTVAVEYLPSIDRITYFGPVEAPNLLHVRSLRQRPKADGSYTFFGGAYTWIAPQSGPYGWVGADGNQSPWPPDPAMDIGPGGSCWRGEVPLGVEFRVKQDVYCSPPTRMGLAPTSHFAFTSDSCLELTHSLENKGSGSRLAGAWINTAASNDHTLAVRAPFGSEVWAWEGKDSKPLTDLMSQPNERGWALIDLSKANWEGGIKFYIQPGAVGGETKVDIAQWFGGYWMYRSQEDCGAEDFALLRENGEGPVAVYIQPGAEPIIEAELYGRLVNLAPGQTERWTETWRVIEAATPDVSVLP